MSPEQEVARLENLGAYRVLDTPADGRYDRIVALVADLFDAPIVAISLVDEKRQWFKASKGLDVCQTPRDWSFCSRAIEQPEPVFIVAHPQSDPRFCDNPLVTGALHIRFYAGARLEDSRGLNLGALCIIDTKERPLLSVVQHQALAEFARLVTQQ
jgi:GAF domain-containing protein